MSSTSATGSPEFNTGNAQPATQADAQLSKSAASKVFRVAPPQLSNNRPLTQGTWTHTLDPLSIQFRAAAGDPAISDFDKQKEVTGALWGRLQHLIPKSGYEPMGFVFGVIFDQDADSVPYITLCCSTSASCKAIAEELSVIIVDHSRQRASVYTQHASLNVIPEELVPIDVCGASVLPSELSCFVDALGKAVSSNGSLSGPVRTMITAVEGHNTLQRVVRAFVKLLPAVMEGALCALLNNGEMMLPWKGTDLMIRQLCRHLPCYKTYATAWPDQVAIFEGRAAAGQSSADGPEDSVTNSPGSASKKRKSSSE